MIQLFQCPKCKGFLALAIKHCPHCEAPVDRVRQAAMGLATIAGGGAVSMTLMACYGSACVDGQACDYTPTTEDAGEDAGDVDGATLDAASDAHDSATDGGLATDASDASDALTDAPAEGG